ncbi:hypothetical protein EZS27_023527 [termite gut metagenome]|jgi:hypothetical protein|uniref:Uncharacterized protein n=1 Tax=termite gut metagenome TaxID=433724 RepID=A0A5J4R3F1_9ZZZZ
MDILKYLKEFFLHSIFCFIEKFVSLQPNLTIVCMAYNLLKGKKGIVFVAPI